MTQEGQSAAFSGNEYRGSEKQKFSFAWNSELGLMVATLQGEEIRPTAALREQQKAEMSIGPIQLSLQVTGHPNFSSSCMSQSVSLMCKPLGIGFLFGS